jgi:hypothetical protein
MIGRNAIREVVMANRAQPFKTHHVVRALKAAAAAGVAHPSIEFHSPDGGKIVIGGIKDFAKGGSTRMLPPQSAGPQQPARTGHTIKSAASGAAKASGGSRTLRTPTLAMPAAPGRTAPPKKGR